MHRIFVYGTLRPSLREKYGFYRGSDIPEGRKIHDGRIAGKIYPLGGRVPGVRLEPVGSEFQVVGEVVEVNDKELAILDQLEAGYRRVKVSVEVVVGGFIDAEVYEIGFQPRVGNVQSGDWAEYLEGKFKH